MSCKSKNARFISLSGFRLLDSRKESLFSDRETVEMKNAQQKIMCFSFKADSNLFDLLLSFDVRTLCLRFIVLREQLENFLSPSFDCNYLFVQFSDRNEAFFLSFTRAE